MLFLVTKFPFLKFLCSGLVSHFLSVRDHIFALIALVTSVSLQGGPIWRSNFFPSLFLVTNVTILRKDLIFHSSELVAPGDVPNGSSTIVRHARRNCGVCLHYICTSGPR